MKESKVELHLVEGVELLGGLALKLLGFVGWPDRTILLPSGRIYFAEIKQPKGRRGPLQSYWERTLKGLGFHHEFLWSIEQVDAFLETLKT